MFTFCSGSEIIMVNKCCVPGCVGNYDAENKVHIFKFPADEDLRIKWLQAIKRDNFIPSKHSVVSSFHFKPYILTKVLGRVVIGTFFSTMHRPTVCYFSLHRSATCTSTKAIFCGKLKLWTGKRELH